MKLCITCGTDFDEFSTNICKPCRMENKNEWKDVTKNFGVRSVTVDANNLFNRVMRSLPEGAMKSALRSFD